MNAGRMEAVKKKSIRSSNIKKFLKRSQCSIISGLTSRIFRATNILREKQDVTDVRGLTFMELSKGMEDIT